jgi:HK97 family phage major capsid protein
MANATQDPTEKIINMLDNKLGEITKGNKDLVSRIDQIEKQLNEPVTKGINPAHLFHATSGPVGKDSAGYSIAKAAGYANGYINKENAKEEIEASNKLKKLYKAYGYQAHHQANSFLVPYSTEHIPQDCSEGIELATELRQKQMGSVSGYDPEEADWNIRKAFGSQHLANRRKAMGTVSDTAGGVLLGYPTLGELIDLQRNMEVFARAGARDVTLPPNAMIDYPKLTGGATAYWVGEAATITSSDETTGSLKLVGKKLGVLVKINNELFRYAGPSTEGMIRQDMAMVAALKADLAMLEGTGGTQIKGLTTYPTASSWTSGTDSMLAYTVTSNLLQPEDINKMIGVLPDAVQDLPLTFIMRNNMWGVISSRRADSVSAADGKGPFVFNLTRGAGEAIPKQLAGNPVVTSSQVSNTRGSGAQTYVLAGAFQDWIVGRFGVMEFLATNTGDTAFQADQTWLRAIQILDAGPRNSASFLLADSITIS